MSEPSTHPPEPRHHADSPITAMLVSLSGAGGPAHETGPPGANELSVRAGHEPDRFQVRSILYVPAAVVVVLILAYLIVTGLFAWAMSYRASEDERGRRENPQIAALTDRSIEDRLARISSTDPQPIPEMPGTGRAQPRLEGLQQTIQMPGDDPHFYRSRLPDPDGNNPIPVRPEDLRPENYVSRYLDPVAGRRILAEYGWADEGQRLARVPINEAIRMVVQQKKLPVRKDPVVVSATTEDKAKQSNAGRGGLPPAAPPEPEPKQDEPKKEESKQDELKKEEPKKDEGERKDDTQPEKK
jgi:hypothetical protein